MAQGCTRKSRYNRNVGKCLKRQATQLQLGRNAHPAWQPKVRNSVGHGNMGITSHDTVISCLGPMLPESGPLPNLTLRLSGAQLDSSPPMMIHSFLPSPSQLDMDWWDWVNWWIQIRWNLEITTKLSCITQSNTLLSLTITSHSHSPCTKLTACSRCCNINAFTVCTYMVHTLRSPNMWYFKYTYMYIVQPWLPTPFPQFSCTRLRLVVTYPLCTILYLQLVVPSSHTLG